MNNVILAQFVRLATVPAWCAAVWLLWRGHQLPGGGFIAALVAGAVVALGRLATPERPSRLPSAETLLAVGMLTVVAVAATPLIFDGVVLEGAKWYVPVPIVGPVKIVSSLIFDIGVFSIVVGVVAAICDRFGGQQ